jgi:hypothetical protein
MRDTSVSPQLEDHRVQVSPRVQVRPLGATSVSDVLLTV